MPRRPTHRYVDPLDAIWTAAAAGVGLRIRRSPEAFAASDGRGELVLGTPDTLDPDDCLAQMVLHELCHTLVVGPEAFDRADWGLENVDDRDLEQEHATLRVQAALTAPFGLRALLAPTTEHRRFWDALPADPLDPAGGVSGVALARAALPRADRAPWAPHLGRALEVTAKVADLVRAAGAADARPGGSGSLPSLWSRLDSGEQGVETE